MGSLRHYFNTQSGLLAFAMRLVGDRARTRIEGHTATHSDALAGADTGGSTDATTEAGAEARHHAGARQAVERVLEELLPLDDERRVEAEVWYAFTGRALVDPELRQLRGEVYDQLRWVCAELVDALVRHGRAPPTLDVGLETERLYALIDGLTVHAILRPEAFPAGHIRAVLARHLDEVCGKQTTEQTTEQTTVTRTGADAARTA